jgi:hypothetical protein
MEGLSNGTLQPHGTVKATPNPARLSRNEAPKHDTLVDVIDGLRMDSHSPSCTCEDCGFAGLMEHFPKTRPGASGVGSARKNTQIVAR